MPIAQEASPGSRSTGGRDARPTFPRPWPRRSWPGSNKVPQAVVWTAPTGPRPNSPPLCIRRKGSRSASGPCGRSVPNMTCARIAQRISISKAIRTSRKRPAKTWTPLNKATAGYLVLLSQDEARFSMVPTLRTTLGVKGYRPVVGNLDCRDVLYVFGALNLVTGRLTTRIVERPRTPTRATQRYLQEAFAHHLRDIARTYPAAQYPRVVIVID